MIIKGKIRRIFFQKPNWASILLKTEDDEVKCAGAIVGSIMEGSKIELEGEFFTDPTYGRQFKVASTVKVHEAATPNSIKKFLTTFLQGVGEKTAELIFDEFGFDTLDIIKSEEKYKQLCNIKGITEKKAEKIHVSYMLNKAYEDIVNFFKGDVTENQAYKIYEKYQDKALEMLRTNPYQLIYDIDGMGFKKVDKLALASGIKPDARERVGAAIVYTLKTISDGGDVFVDSEELEIKINDCLNREKLDVKLTINRLADEITEQVKEEKLVLEPFGNQVRVYLKYLYDAEISCAKDITDMLKDKSIRKKDYLPDIIKSEKKNNITFDDIQRSACNMALNNKLSVITGGPGMGKTTIIKQIIEIKKAYKVICLAPTGKAAKRMQEATGHQSYTIDSFILSKQKSMFFDTDTLFIIDEASMIDIVKAKKLLDVINKEGSSALFVGDIHQLPSIGAGNFLRDLISNPLIPTTTLKFSYRFGGKIGYNADCINNGRKFSELDFSDKTSMSFVKAEKEIAKQMVEKLYTRALNHYDAKDILVISPMKARSQTATNLLNESLREIHNPKPNRKANSFEVGDRVMNTSNDYRLEGYNTITGETVTGVCNGDTGTITSLSSDGKKMTVLLDDGTEFEFLSHHISCIVPAYAITFHKSQGSEAKCVIMVLNKEHYTMLNRNLFYTGVTRGKECVCLVGDTWAINKAIENTIALTRNTGLSEKITELANKVAS